MDEQGHVAAVIDDEIGAADTTIGSGPQNGLQRALPVVLEGLSLPGEHGSRLGSDDGRGGVVLGAEDVARAPSERGAAGLQRLDEDGRLHGHVERTRDTSSRKSSGVLLAAGHQTGHLVLGKGEVLSSPLGKGHIGNLQRQELRNKGRTL